MLQFNFRKNERPDAFQIIFYHRLADVITKAAVAPEKVFCSTALVAHETNSNEVRIMNDE